MILRLTPLLEFHEPRTRGLALHRIYPIFETAATTSTIPNPERVVAGPRPNRFWFDRPATAEQAERAGTPDWWSEWVGGDRIVQPADEVQELLRPTP